MPLAPVGAAAQQPGAGQTPPPAVVVEPIEVRPVSDPAEFNARVEAIGSVDVRARVPGFIETVVFEAGQMVEAGELLFEIEPDQYEAAVASAEAQLARADAAREEAARALARTRELFEEETVAEATLDQARADFEIAEAEVELAQAALRSAELDLSYTRIFAPTDGRIGRALFTKGNLVGPDSGHDTVSKRRIGTGARVDNGWAVTEGLSGGERVVVQGVQRLSEGMRVQPSQGQPVRSGS